MTLTVRGTALRVLLIGVLLTYPLWYRPVMRRIDTQMSRRELAVEAERVARASGTLVRGPSGETFRAVVYTASDPHEAGTVRYVTWMFRLVALTVFLQLVLGAISFPEDRAEIDD